MNLRGYDPDRPVTPAEALAGFLRGLGVSGEDIPLDLDERAARYRTQVAGRRMLVVLDNAATVEQVRPLLPGSPTAMVVVTSRDSLAGLVALHGARRVELDLLPAADGLALLRELVGRRVDAEPGAAARLAEQCAGLPLALRVAAELAAARPAIPLSELVAELDDQHRRLDLLDAGGDPRAAVTAVFSWSYRSLPPDAARAFRLAGLHPGPDADAYGAAGGRRKRPGRDGGLDRRDAASRDRHVADRADPERGIDDTAPLDDQIVGRREYVRHAGSRRSAGGSCVDKLASVHHGHSPPTSFCRDVVRFKPPCQQPLAPPARRPLALVEGVSRDRKGKGIEPPAARYEDGSGVSV